MANWDIFLAFLQAIGLGALIGLEREMQAQKNNNEDLGGLRTFAMMAALGFLSAYLMLILNSKALFIAIFIVAVFFSFITHVSFTMLKKQFGITSELSLMTSFLVGSLVALEKDFLAMVIALAFTIMLSLKGDLHKMAGKLNRNEFFAIIKFLILSAIFLPLLPKSYETSFIDFDWRPQDVWLMVMLVASIRFIGYFLAKILGSEKSIMFSGIVGGFISSTAVTTSISAESKGKKTVVIFLLPILFANAIMFIRVLFEVAMVAGHNTNFLALLLWPLLLATITLFIVASIIIFLQKKNDQGKSKNPIEIGHPLEMKSAISFGLFFIIILFLAEKIPQFLPDSGLVITGAISGLTDVDAITLAMSQEVSNNELMPKLAAQVILIAIISNTIVKTSIIFLFGNKKLFFWSLLSLTLAFVVGGSFFLI